jgi:hypothetical protein
MGIGSLSIGVDVKTNLSCTTDVMPLTSGVRLTDRRGVSGREAP